MVAVARDYKKLSQELVDRGLISPADLVEAIRVHKQSGLVLQEVLIERGLITAGALVSTKAAILNLPVIDLKKERIDPGVLKHVPETLARRYLAVPVSFQGDVLRVAMAEPDDFQAVQDLQAQAACRVQIGIAQTADIIEAIDLYYKATTGLPLFLNQYPVSIGEPVIDAATAEQELAQAPVVRTVGLLLLQGVRDRASDIHIEPQPDRLRVRYRIDGVLQEIVSLPVAIHPALVSRIKIMARMDIAERRLPQDGQFTFNSAGRSVDVRVATIETAYGERVVLRLLDKSSTLLQLPELGFLPESLARFETMLRAPYGMILVCGPTGSGKTTTLYAAMNSMDRQARNIVSIEDPIEYKLTDINQIQVNSKANLTFANGLRAIMRHDPNVIFVGEIRDSDTAVTAVQAALTGHVVLSSIHANNAQGVVSRLTNLGVDEFLIASSLIGVVAQRMLRRVCNNCRALKEPSREEALIFNRELGQCPSNFAYGQGCQFCVSTGYRGRTGIFELMQLTDGLRHLILSHAEPSVIQDQTIQDGMTSLLKDGLLKAQQGITTPAEVIRTSYAPM